MPEKSKKHRKSSKTEESSKGSKISKGSKTTSKTASKTAQTAPKKYAERIFSDDERKEMLSGYTELDPADWDMLAPPVFIRVEKTNGKFLRGGQVVRIFQNSDEDSKRVELRATSTNKTFSLRLNDLKKIWSKGTVTDLTPGSALADQVAALAERVAQLEIKNQRTVALLGKATSRIVELERR